MQRVVFITGGNRGIGLELTRLFLSNGDLVFATYRKEETASALFAEKEKHGDNLYPVCCDVANTDSVKECFREVALKTKHIDILINNAGILKKGESHIELVTEENLIDTFNVNVIGVWRVTQTFLPLVRKGSVKKILNVSSIMASIERNTGGRSHSYRISKAALNMFTRSVAMELQPEGIVCYAVHPGWVQTDMGGPNAEVTPRDSATSLLATLERATIEEHTGKYFDKDGEELPF